MYTFDILYTDLCHILIWPSSRSLDVLEVWMTVQRNWLYLQPIFESPDINRQLPTEGKKNKKKIKNKNSMEMFKERKKDGKVEGFAFVF